MNYDQRPDISINVMAPEYGMTYGYGFTVPIARTTKSGTNLSNRLNPASP